MTDVKLFDENAPFQVKGLHIRGELKKYATPFTFLSAKGKKKKILKYRLILYANANGTRWKKYN